MEPLTNKNLDLILASSSPYRRELLQRLNLEFRCISPDIDETIAPAEKPEELVLRLALQKAEKIAQEQANSLIISSDQTLSIGVNILGKAGNFAKAKEQLLLLSGKTATFFTSICLLNSGSGRHQLDLVTVDVSFRQLSNDEIERYLHAEQPYDCAGSFKSEKLGVTLMEKMSTDDPTALIGLPLIRLCQMLRQEGLNLP